MNVDSTNINQPSYRDISGCFLGSLLGSSPKVCIPKIQWIWRDSLFGIDPRWDISRTWTLIEMVQISLVLAESYISQQKYAKMTHGFSSNNSNSTIVLDAFSVGMTPRYSKKYAEGWERIFARRALHKKSLIAGVFGEWVSAEFSITKVSRRPRVFEAIRK